MKIKVLLIILLCSFSFLSAQDSLPEHLVGKVNYPVFDFHQYIGVIDVEFDKLQYDPEIDYKIVIDVYEKLQDSSKILSALSQVARVYNLNISNGVPRDKIKMAVVIHGFAVDAILNNEKYKEKYGLDNPNIEMLIAYKNEGLDLYVCGQNISIFKLKEEDISDAVGIAISAKTALIHLDQKGYTYLDVNTPE